MSTSIKKMKAWKVTHADFPGTTIIHKAKTRHQARYKSTYNAWEAGYELAYIKTAAVRAPEFDDLPDPPLFFSSLGWSDGGERWGCLFPDER